MPRHKRLLIASLTLALGLGVWAGSFSYQAATFADGDVLSAAALNALLNDNFQAAADALETRVARSGDTMSGPLVIDAPAASSNGSAVATLGATNTGGNGFAAFFQSSDAANTDPTTAIVNAGSGPALFIKATGGGPLISANDVFVVANDGSIRLGTSGNPALVLDATAGTITNAVGAGLPIAYGRVTPGGAKSHGTSNWTSTYNAVSQRYEITIDGVNFSHTLRNTATITPGGSSRRYVGLDSAGGSMLVFIHDASGNPTQNSFTFIVY